ncbi:MAG: hypothetical protein AABX93_01195 [Nanoarchaeota archaeon]
MAPGKHGGSYTAGAQFHPSYEDPSQLKSYVKKDLELYGVCKLRNLTPSQRTDITKLLELEGLSVSSTKEGVGVHLSISRKNNSGVSQNA